MDKFDRIYKLHHLLNGRRTPIRIESIQEHLDCSRASAYRLISDLEDQLMAPIVRTEDGVRYDPKAKGTYELPGLWFNARELHARLTFHQLLEHLEPGLLRDHLAPLEKRLHTLLEHRHLNLTEAARRVRILAMVARSTGDHFQSLANATLSRNQIEIIYHSRGKDQHTQRRLCPQRLTHYRDAWYLDAFDHLRGQLRTFSVDRVHSVRVLEDSARDLPDRDLDEHFASAYGIFGGKANKTAVLKFTAERARWVADERWHPLQKGQFHVDGSFELRIPYRDQRELVMDILRHGAHVEVLAPDSLRQTVAATLQAASARYLDQSKS